jgi:SAM-dependent methyltransferase
VTGDAITPPNLRADAFVGTAADYLRYRPPYPAELLRSLLAAAELPASGAKLIDLACGTGRVALAVADRFDEILAVDLEPEMVATARREAVRRGVRQVQWSVGRAEAFAAPAGHCDLVTIGEAFHRLDRPRVANRAFGWLKGGGAIATLGMESFLAGDAPWRRILAAVVARYVGTPAQRAGGTPNPPVAEAIADERAVLRAAGFVDLAAEDFVVAHAWTLPDLLGNLRSTSVLSHRALRERQPAFEAELSAALLAFDRSGRYAEQVRCGYTVARKPRDPSG